MSNTESDVATKLGVQAGPSHESRDEWDRLRLDVRLPQPHLRRRDLALHMGLRFNKLDLSPTAYEVLKIFRFAKLERIYNRTLTEEERRHGRRYLSDEDGNAVVVAVENRSSFAAERQQSRYFSSDEEGDAVPPDVLLQVF